MARNALKSYQSQTYDMRELVIVEDGYEPIADLVHGIPNVTYLRLTWEAKNLAVKRNMGIKNCRGEIVIHFDADDFSTSTRIEKQVDVLERNPDVSVTGFSTVCWYDFKTRQASRFTGGIWGATFAYRKKYALENPWNEGQAIAEDVSFLSPAQDSGMVLETDGRDLFVAGMPEGNVKRFPIGLPEWREKWPIIRVTDLPVEFRMLIH